MLRQLLRFIDLWKVATEQARRCCADSLNAELSSVSAQGCSESGQRRERHRSQRRSGRRQKMMLLAMLMTPTATLDGWCQRPTAAQEVRAYHACPRRAALGSWAAGGFLPASSGVRHRSGRRWLATPRSWNLTSRRCRHRLTACGVAPLFQSGIFADLRLAGRIPCSALKGPSTGAQSTMPANKPPVPGPSPARPARPG